MKRPWSYVKIKKQNSMNAAPGSNHYLNQNNLTIINQNNLTTCQYKDKHKVFNMQVFF
jgi:hypothetical protein